MNGFGHKTVRLLCAFNHHPPLTQDLSDITDANSLNSLSSKLESLDFVSNPVIVNGGILQSSAQVGRKMDSLKTYNNGTLAANG